MQEINISYKICHRGRTRSCFQKKRYQTIELFLRRSGDVDRIKRAFRLADRVSDIEKTLGRVESKVIMVDGKFPILEKTIERLESKVNVLDGKFAMIEKSHGSLESKVTLLDEKLLI